MIKMLINQFHRGKLCPWAYALEFGLIQFDQTSIWRISPVEQLRHECWKFQNRLISRDDKAWLISSNLDCDRKNDHGIIHLDNFTGKLTEFVSQYEYLFQPKNFKNVTIFGNDFKTITL